MTLPAQPEPGTVTKAAELADEILGDCTDPETLDRFACRGVGVERFAALVERHGSRLAINVEDLIRDIARERFRRLTPARGMGATIYVGSDRYAATVAQYGERLGVVFVRRDKAIRTDSTGAFSERQDYLFEPQPEAPLEAFKRDKLGKWRAVEKNPETGRYRQTGSAHVLVVGYRSEYRDPSF